MMDAIRESKGRQSERICTQPGAQELMQQTGTIQQAPSKPVLCHGAIILSVLPPNGCLLPFGVLHHVNHGRGYSGGDTWNYEIVINADTLMTMTKIIILILIMTYTY
jgi:hypothetical protein